MIITTLDCFKHTSSKLTTLSSIDDKWAFSVLQKLRFDSGTGSDQISTKVLRNCAAPLAAPVSFICNMILDQGRWPAPWRYHWICPIHKRKSKADPDNCRGAHLTSQLSKVCDRILGPGFQKLFEAGKKFGPRQFAYMKGRGCCGWKAVRSWGYTAAMFLKHLTVWTARFSFAKYARAGYRRA